jgi:hypothetical protein
VTLKKLLRTVGLVAAVGTSVWAFERFIIGWKPENRFLLYQIRQQLRPGMTMSDVAQVVDNTPGPRPRTYVSDDQRYMTLSVGVGLQSEYDLRLEFRDGQLVRAVVRDADNGAHPADAPPDL